MSEDVFFLDESRSFGARTFGLSGFRFGMRSEMFGVAELLGDVKRSHVIDILSIVRYDQSKVDGSCWLSLSDWIGSILTRVGPTSPIAHY